MNSPADMQHELDAAVKTQPPASVRPTMTVDEVAVALAYWCTKKGQRIPDRRKVYQYARAEASPLPTPIEMALPMADWRWSRSEIETYISGSRQGAS